jgi:hypothetical protein
MVYKNIFFLIGKNYIFASIKSKMVKQKPNFSQNLFWDVDINTLDIDLHSKFILERVLQYGDLDDWRKVKNYYPVDDIKTMALDIRTIDPKSLNFIAAYLNIPITEFRCYKLSQSDPQPWFS